MPSVQTLTAGDAVGALSDAEPRVGVFAWWMPILFALYYAISIFDRTILVHLVDLIKLDLKATDFQMSLVLGPAFGVCYAIFGYPFGWATDRFQRRWLVFAGLTLWSVATILSGFAGSIWQLALARMAVAIGEAALIPVATSMIADRFPPQRLASALAVFNMGHKAGQSVAFVFAGLAIAVATAASAGALPFVGDRKAWQLVLFIAGAPGLIAALLVFTLREPPRQRSPSAAAGADTSGFLQFITSQWRVVVPLFLGFCGAGIASNALMAWVPTFLGREYGWTAVQYGPWLGALSALGALSLLAKGAIVDWLYSRGMRDAALRFYTWLLIAFAPIGTLSFFAPNPYVFLIAYGFINVVAIPFTLYALTTIQLFTPKEFRGRMTGAFLLVMPMLSIGIGPTATAALTDFVFRDPSKLGWSLAIVTAACMAVSIVLLRYALNVMARGINASVAGRPNDS